MIAPEIMATAERAAADPDWADRRIHCLVEDGEMFGLVAAEKIELATLKRLRALANPTPSQTGQVG